MCISFGYELFWESHETTCLFLYLRKSCIWIYSWRVLILQNTCFSSWKPMIWNRKIKKIGQNHLAPSDGPRDPQEPSKNTQETDQEPPGTPQEPSKMIPLLTFLITLFDCLETCPTCLTFILFFKISFFANCAFFFQHFSISRTKYYRIYKVNQ